MAVSNLKVTFVWPVEKYARFISEGGAGRLLEGKKGGSWQHYSSRDGVIQMALLESNHLMVSSGNQIYESFSLWETKKWIKAVTKGDSLLFLYRLKGENRKFRVKFAPSLPNSSSLDTCKRCIAQLADLVPIREMTANLVASKFTEGACGGSDSQFPYSEDAFSQPLQEASLPLTQTWGTMQGSIDEGTKQQRQGSNDESLSAKASGATRASEEWGTLPSDSELMSIPDIAKTVLHESKRLGRAYAETNFPTEQLGAFIRLCLTDANFPAFVEAVDKELNSITSSD